MKVAIGVTCLILSMETLLAQECPHIVGVGDTPDEAWGVAVYNNIAYVADEDAGIVAVDVSDINNPSVVSTTSNPPIECWDIKSYGDQLVVADDYQIQRFDLEDPYHPTLVGSASATHPYDLEMVGDYAYVANSVNVAIYYLNPNGSIQQISTIPGLVNPVDIDVSGTIVAIADGTGGVAVVDATFPSSPEILFHIANSSNALSVSVIDNNVFAAISGIGVRVFDVSDLDNVLINSTIPFSSVHCVNVDDGIMTLVDNAVNLYSYDMSAIEDPIFIGSVLLPAYPRRIVSFDQNVIVPCGSYGIQIVKPICVTDNYVIDEPFNHSGTLPPGWTTQSNAAFLTTPWAPILESGTDYAIQTSHVAFSNPRTEWLISPIYNLMGYQDIELGYTHAYTHAGSTATVKYSTNGGLSWQNLTSYNATTSGNIITNLSWATNQANVRFAFVFTGTFNIGGSSWRIDDFFLDGTPRAPLASTPVPSQPPTAWANLTGNVGCTWTQPLGVSGTDLEVRIDANGDWDYLDGGAENWQPIADLPDTTSLTFSTSVTYLQAGTDLAFEFRARSGQGLWGYSGTSNAEGIEDDWIVSIDMDSTPPTFADPIPTSQPNPDWLPTLSPQVGVSMLDADSGVDASTLVWRIDLDQNGSYSGPAEDWQPITGYADGSQVDVLQTPILPTDGEYRVQFRAKDLAGNGPANSGDIVVRVDATPPTPSTLFVAGSGLDSVTLMFSPTSEDHFARYEIRCSQDTLVDESDILWTDAQDPNLAQIGTYQTTITGLSSGTAWYFRLWGVDLAGNRSPASNLVRKVTEGSEVSPVTDLHAVLQGIDILLSWTAPTTDIYGQSPVAIEEYQVHSSLDARFTPNASTLVGTTTSTSYLVVNPGGDVRAFYRVVAVGAGPLMTINGGLVPWGNQNFGMNNLPDYDYEFTDIACGDEHSVALRQDGTIVLWGNNSHGQCSAPIPNQGFIDVCAGTFHTIVLKSDGSVVCFGDNSFGQLEIPSPNTGFVSVSAGDFHSIAMRQDGSLVMWGKNDEGQCVPNQPNSGYVLVSGGTRHTIALRNNGTLEVFGSNGYGQLNVPGNNQDFIYVSAGDYHNVAVKSDGSIVAWGKNDNGQCNVPNPNSGFLKAVAGEEHSIGLRLDGTISCWGWNAYNQCNVPEPNTNYVLISAGEHHSLAIRRQD